MITKHRFARTQIHKVLTSQGFASKQDRDGMIDDTLAAIKENPAECVEICAGLLGLEWGYISPLTQPDAELYVDEHGRLREK